MALSKTVNNGDTTLNFSYTAATQKINDTALDAAHILFNERYYGGQELNGLAFDELTVNQQAIILDEYVKKVIVELAKRYNISNAEVTARATAEVENAIKYL